MSNANHECNPGVSLAPRYVIATVSDFLAVPQNRQADCMSEFVRFLGVARGIAEIAKLAGNAVGIDAAAQIGPFVWLDDGRRKETIRIDVPNAPAYRTPELKSTEED